MHLRLVFLTELLCRDKTDSANGDGALLTVPNGIGLRYEAVSVSVSLRKCLSVVFVVLSVAVCG